MKIYSGIQHPEHPEYITNANFGGSVHIAFKMTRDLLYYVHPPSFTVF
jgi:hypothetical protein